LEKVANTVKPPTKIGHLLDRARQLAFDGEPDKAKSACEKILEIKPKSPAALMLLGDIHKQMGNGDMAVQAYEEAHKSERMYLEPIKKLSLYYRETGERQKELEQLRKLDKLSPYNVERKMKIGDIQLQLGDADMAENLYEDMIDVTRQEMNNKIYRMHLDVAEKMLPVDAARAEKYYRKALEVKGDQLGPKDVNAFNRLGMALRRQKKPREAVAEYQKALEISPEDENLYYNIALAYLEAGEAEQSLEAVEQALALNEHLARDNEKISYNLGLIYLKNKDRERALSCFEYALEVKQDYEPALRMLAKMEQA
jgi:tetratricopeptide (TPR) repeat protein